MGDGIFIPEYLVVSKGWEGICKGLREIAPKDLVVKNGTDEELDSYFVIEG